MSTEENVEIPVLHPTYRGGLSFFDISKFVSGNNKFHPVVQFNGVRWCRANTKVVLFLTLFYQC